jgi:hypothetical protein
MIGIKNNSQANIRVHDADLPWRFSSASFEIKALDSEGRELEQQGAIPYAINERLLYPGEMLVGILDLQERFPGIEEVNEPARIVWKLDISRAFGLSEAPQVGELSASSSSCSVHAREKEEKVRHP